MWDLFMCVTVTLLEYVTLMNTTWFTQNFPNFSTESPMSRNPFRLSFKTERPRPSQPVACANVTVS